MCEAAINAISIDVIIAIFGHKSAGLPITVSGLPREPIRNRILHLKGSC